MAMASVHPVARDFVHYGAFAPSVDKALRDAGWRRVEVEQLDNVPEALRRHDAHVALLDLGAGQAPMLRRVERLIASHPATEWLAHVSEHALTDKHVCEVIYGSFFDFCTQPVDINRLLTALGHAWGMAKLGPRTANAEQQAAQGLDGMVGTSAALVEMHNQVRKLAAVNVPVLITGESGTGKEVAARNLHRLSARARGPFVAINCGALPEKLVQSELFGHERGAFTGANARKIGKLESAQQGTVFLDEIGDLPLDAQVNLLRFLQEGTIERIGGNEHLRLDVRVIAATHVDLERAVAEGQFRADLYYRLNVLRLRMPPLRERGQDAEMLARYFLERFAREHGVRARGYSRDALDAISLHPWPGNVRELMNRVRRAAVLCDGGLIRAQDLELESDPAESRCALSLEHAREQAERELIQQTLRETRHNMSECARRLGISRVTLYRLCKKLQVSLGSAA